MTTESSSTPINLLDAIVSAAQTDIGMRREENQDSHGIIEAPGFKLFMVADGMGGVRGGATASKIAVGHIETALKSLTELTREKIIAAVTAANDEILKKASEEPELSGMGTTLVALAFTSSKLYVTNVGDSRAYRIRQGSIEQLTEDHTLVNELLRSGSITPSQAQSHPVSHMLTRSLGPAADVEVDCLESKEPPAAGDLYMLCSDGLYNLISPREMAEVAALFPITEIGPELISLANLRGGPDNITVITVQVGTDYGIPAQSSMPTDSSASTASSSPSRENTDDSASQDTEKPVEREPAQDAQVDSQSPPNEGPRSPNPEQVARVASASQAENASSSIGPLLWEYRYPLLIIVLSAFITVVVTIILSAPAPTPAPSPTAPTAEEIPLVSAPPLKADVEVAVPPYSSAAAPSVQDNAQHSEVAEIDAPAEAQKGSPAAAHQAPLEHAASKSRPEMLADQIQELEAKLQLFDQPISGQTAQLLGDSLAKVGEAQNRRDAISFELDRTGTALNKWVDVKHRLTDKNQVDLASEVASLSTEIRETLEVFRRATWNYLQATDGSELTSPSVEHQTRLEQLAKARTEALAALGLQMQELTERKILETDSKVKELTLQRYELNEKISALQEEIAFHRILVGSDTAARDLKRREIESSLAKSKDELKQLQQIPDLTASPVS